MSVSVPTTAEPVRLVRATAGVVLSLAGVACGLTLMFLAMRAVMQVGGFCAEGGPYVIQQECPQGTPAALLLGLFGGLVCLGLYLAVATAHRVPNLGFLSWPALFLSLGYNFFDFGFDPPFGDGVAWGWILCGVVFFALGGTPLVLFLLPSFRRSIKEPPEPLAPSPREVMRVALQAAGRVRREGVGLRDIVVRGTDEDVTSKLERLAALHSAGALSDEEYDAAKRAVLEGL